MLQFYFLSIFFNALTGFLIVSGDSDGIPEFGKKFFSAKDETFRLVAGILAAVTGFLKILSPIEGDIPVIGDIVPALAGFLSGFVLVFEYYRVRSTVNLPEQTEKIDRILLRNKKILGVAAIVTAALHFIFPKALLL